MTTATYNYDSMNFQMPITGFGNFSGIYQPNLKCKIDTTNLDKRIELFNQSDMNQRLVMLKSDKSLFCYAWFKFNNKPLIPRFFQDIMLNDSHKRILFCASNQIGKSLALDIDAAVEFAKDHHHEWVGILVSKSLDQSQYQMSRIRQLLKSGNITYKEEETIDSKTGKKDNTTQISYTFYDDFGKPIYTNLLICCPPTGSALGYPCDRMWLDEFDFWKDINQNEFIKQIAIPRTFDTKGSIIIYTNPNGKDKYMYSLWNEKYPDTNKYVWHRYNFNFWDKPGASQEEYNENSVGMTRGQIDSTLLAVFSQSAGAFLSSQEIEEQIDQDLCEKKDQAGYGKETAWFLDVGSVHDQSALIGAYISENVKEPDIPIINAFYVHKYPVGYPLGRLVGVENKEGIKDGWEDEADDNPSVKETLQQYSEEYNGKMFLPMFGCDVTGNSGIIPLFNTAGIEPIDITFSGRKKWNMYQRYQYYTQQRYFKRCIDRDSNTMNGCDFSYQASKLVVKKGTNTNYRQIHHENEDDYDDTQDAVVGVIHLIENPDMPSLSYDIINHGESRLKEIEEESEKIKRFKKNNPNLKDQYIPGFYNTNELNSWIAQKEMNRT